MEDKHSLKGKVAVVTGSSSGIGAAIALEFAASQAHVIVHARSSQAEGERVVAAVREHGVESTLMHSFSSFLHFRQQRDNIGFVGRILCG